MRSSVYLAGLLVIQCSCRSEPTKPVSASPSFDCDPASVVPAKLRRPGAVLLIGEVHGTKEFPAFFGEVVCHLSKEHEVNVGLEIPRSEGERIEAYLESAGSPENRAALLKGAFWTRDYQDGRSSEAMFELLERLRQLNGKGARLSVLTFDTEEGGPAREKAMAARIARIAQDRAHAVTAVLTGNLHARTVPGVPWDPDWKPMGWLIAQEGLTVQGLDGSGPPGMAWMCPSTVAADCGPKNVKLNQVDGHDRGIHLFQSPDPGGFIGIYATNAISPSRPWAVSMEYSVPK